MIATGPLKLYPRQRRAEWNGKPLDLTSTEFNLLEALARNVRTPCRQACAVRSRRWDDRLHATTAASTCTSSSIRRKLGTLPDGRTWIQTVVRQGYQLVCE